MIFHNLKRRLVKFSDVVRLNKDRVIDPEAEGIERYVGLEHITPDDLRIRSWGLVSEGTTFTNYFKPGQVLFGKRRAYQRKVAIADFEGVCSGDIYVFESKDPQVLLPELLPFICLTEGFFEHAVGTSAGSLSPRTNWAQLSRYEFALPPLEEQHRITKCLLAFYKTKDSLVFAVQKIRVLRDSLIKEWATQLIVQGTHPIGLLITEIESGKSPSGRAEPAKKGEHGVLKVSAVGNWDFIASENKAIKDIDYIESLEVRDGDFLATRANADPNSVGRTCIVEKAPSGLMISDKTWRIIFKSDNKFNLIGILAWTKSPPFRIHIREQLAGTEAKNISQERFLAGPFPSCTPDEFNKFSEEIITVRLLENKLITRLNLIKNLITKFSDEVLGITHV